MVVPTRAMVSTTLAMLPATWAPTVVVSSVALSSKNHAAQKATKNPLTPTMVQTAQRRALGWLSRP